jgi:hypothetical protein
MSLITRQNNIPNTGPDYIKGTPLTYDQLDGNFASISASFAVRPVFQAGPGIVINGNYISSSIVTVNGIYPSNGNIAINITSTLTGPLSTRPTTAADATVFVVSQDIVANNGDAYIFVAANGTWEPIAPLDQVAGDARYLMLLPQAALQGTLNMGGQNITNGGTFFGTAQTASFVTASNVWGPYGANSVISASNSDTSSFITASNVYGPHGANSVITASFAMNVVQVDPSRIVSGSTVVQTYDTGIVVVTGSTEATTQFIISGSLIAGINSATGLNAVAFGTGSSAAGDYSLAQGDQTIATNDYTHTEGQYTETTAGWSHAEGQGSKTTAAYSHAEGYYTTASGQVSHTEGNQTNTQGFYSHAEGERTLTMGQSSHAEGIGTAANGDYSHAEGVGYTFLPDTINTNAITYFEYDEASGGTVSSTTTAIILAGDYSANTVPYTCTYFYIEDNTYAFTVNTSYYATPIITSITYDSFLDQSTFNFSTALSTAYSYIDGNGNQANGSGSHTEGQFTTATGDFSHAEGSYTIASGSYSHAEGYQSIASGSYSHAEGYQTHATNNGAHAEGVGTIASGNYSHAEGFTTVAIGNESHAEGYSTTASGNYSHAEGSGSLASGEGSHAEGGTTWASGLYSHAEGYYTTASGHWSHAEGAVTTAVGYYSHTEGLQTRTLGGYSHAEGQLTTASGDYSHAEGSGTYASGSHSHAEGTGTVAIGQYSHAEGTGTIASGSGQLAIGSYNKQGNTTSLFVIGNGSSNVNRSDVMRVSGSNVQITGSLIVSSSSIVIGQSSVTGSFIVSSSTNNVATIIGSGSSAPLFSVLGSQGELFSVTDSMSGSLFSVNDISGLSILDVRSDQTTLIGNYLAPVLNATSKITVGTTDTVLYSLPTASYDVMFYELFASSGSSRGSAYGSAVWSGSVVNVEVTQGADFGSSVITMLGGIIGGNFALSGSAPTAGWTFKTIIRAI